MTVTMASGDRFLAKPRRRSRLVAAALGIVLSGAGYALAALEAQPPAGPSRQGPIGAQHSRAISYPSNREYAVLVRREMAGQLQVRLTGAHTLESDYHFSDNGRGPTLRERWTMSPTGIPIDYRSEGNSTFGAVIDERFSIGSDQKLQWRSRIDHGEEIAARTTLLLPLEPGPAFIAQIAATLIGHPERRATLRGGGEASAEILRTMTVTSADQPTTVMLVSVTGIDSDPWLVWLEDRPGLPLFALIDSRIQVIAARHQSLIPDLLAAQTRAEDERLTALQKRLAIPLHGVTLIRNVRWFDPVGGQLLGPSDVWLQDGFIASITRAGNARILPDHLIDGSAQTMIPGLIDTHVHYAADQGLSRLAAGVTTVRDMGSHNELLRATRARIDRGEIAGPLIVPTGFIEGRSRFSSRNGFVVDSLEEARAAVRWYARHGYQTLKLYSSIRPEWVSPIIRDAKRRGLRITGHVPAFMRADDAVEAGFDELAHINQVLLNFVARPDDDTRTLIRFTRVGEESSRFDPTGTEARRFITKLLTHRTIVDPTLVAFEAMFTQRQGEPNPSLAAIADHLPAQWQRELRAADLDLEGPRLGAFRVAFDKMLAMTREMHEAGVPLVTGTDSPHGVSLHRELELYVRAGISPAAALRAATLDAARALGENHRRGSIEPGRTADLVLIAGDPTTRIDDLRRATLVIRGTTAWQPARLYRALGIRPFVNSLGVDGNIGDD